MERGALLRLLLACAAVRAGRAQSSACVPSPAPAPAPVPSPAPSPAPVPGPGPAAALCAGPEPAWTVSDWWPPGAVFRCGCGFTAAGTATAWNDVTICAALGDLLYAAGAPYPDPQTGFYAFNLAGWPSMQMGWTSAVTNVSTDFCDFVGLFCDPAETGDVSNIVGISLSLEAPVPVADDGFFGWADNGGTLRPSFSALASLPGLNTVQLFGGLIVDPELFVPFTGLMTLRLGGLKLQLPASWSALTNLQYLELGGDGVRGTLPPSWSALTNLLSLGLGGNLSGTLPPEFGALTQLTSLLLGSNALQGNIPDSWSKLTALTELDLSHNLLSGTLPEEPLCAMNLTSLYLSFNAFTGSVPAFQCFANNGQLSRLDLRCVRACLVVFVWH